MANPAKKLPSGNPDPNAPRNFVDIKFRLNEYEHQHLGKLAAILGRSKMGTIRWAIVKLAKDELRKAESRKAKH